MQIIIIMGILAVPIDATLLIVFVAHFLWLGLIRDRREGGCWRQKVWPGREVCGLALDRIMPDGFCLGNTCSEIISALA